ncbi:MULTISPECIES: phiSA1p31-related protein [Streptomyces]|uniref:Uncharacterized protein n=1 Tax=Streptomyces dengpaensis TaxID=2049881 RepID=A0ABN5IC54_9ACTN|nr:MULTISPECIES: phiSA1p31-related protein [Streptomyces]AVH59917.1 hypothetical protein C4B68_33750 [Streptomyces dengpaensis]PIB09552.1 hypothetical protein B1C81_10425 [Streptomyces sp. HG99]
MTSLLDGTVIDLDRVQVALDGSHWLWTCEHTESGEPLMLRLDRDGTGALPLADVYRIHGLLAPQAQPTTAAMYRQVLEAA